MKLFHFYRREDFSGVSGTGPVVEGVQFTNGWCALRWISDQSSVCYYQSLEDVKRVHSHGGRTEIIVHDFTPAERRDTPENDARFESLMRLIEDASRAMTLATDAAAIPEDQKTSREDLQRTYDRFMSQLENPDQEAA